jgi:hypothetical protein
MGNEISQDRYKSLQQSETYKAELKKLLVRPSLIITGTHGDGGSTIPLATATRSGGNASITRNTLELLDPTKYHDVPVLYGGCTEYTASERSHPGTYPYLMYQTTPDHRKKILLYPPQKDGRDYLIMGVDGEPPDKKQLLKKRWTQVFG